MQRSLLISCIIINYTVIIFSCGEKEKGNIKTNQPRQTIVSTDKNLQLINGEWFYNKALFNGEIKELYPDGTLQSSRQLQNGRQQGPAFTFYPGGKAESSRWYSNGDKDSIHTGWWPNGNKKFEYHFSKGNYNGLFAEWYQSGKMMQQVMYDNGKEVSGKGWRENGKVYMSFVIKNGRRYGLMNANLCYSLVKEEVK